MSSFITIKKIRTMSLRGGLRSKPTSQSQKRLNAQSFWDFARNDIQAIQLDDKLMLQLLRPQ